MEIDLASPGAADFLAEPARLRAEVCIVGGGIAGLLLADRLAAGGADVLVLEAGGRSLPLAGAQSHAGVELSGEPHQGSREGRPQVLGGSSLVWGGQLLPMLPGTEWPGAAEKLERFAEPIEALMGVDGLPYDAEAFLRSRNQPMLPGMEPLPGLVARMSKFAPFGSRNLGRSLGGRLRNSARVRIWLNAQVTALQMGPGERARAVLVRTPAGSELPVLADTVVLAAGTVETCRLLLASKAHGGEGAPGGVGNQFGQVGRRFQDHLTVEVARFEGAGRDRAVDLFRPWIVGGLSGTMHGLKLEATGTLRRSLRLNHALAHVSFEEPETEGVAAVRAMLLARQRGERSAGVNWRSLPGALLGSWRLRQDIRVNGRRHMSAGVCVGLRVNVAQGAGGGSRVELSDRTDAWGEPLARVHWVHAPGDLRTIRVFAEHLRRWFHGQGWEGIEWRPEALPLRQELWRPGEPAREEQGWDRPLPGVEDARHAVGGACMGADPHTSVVDTDLKVHGIENLYVASAAVFPDGGAQLPTMTLMALVLRLAEHLQARRAR